MAPVSRSVRRLSANECEVRRDQLRADQLRRQVSRREKLQRGLRRRNRMEIAQGLAFLLALIAMFALVYWLAVSDSVPAAF